MGPPARYPVPTRIYRITHIDNLPGILQEGGLWCGNEVEARGLTYTAIGNTDLTVSRSSKRVTCGAGGTLNDYVPFYFCPRSVMLYLIERRHSSTYGGGQEPIIHLVTSVQRIQQDKIPFVFYDRHAYVFSATAFDRVENLAKLDWDTLKSLIWHNTLSDPDRQERKMAEFLAKGFVPWETIQGIGVYNKRYLEDTKAILARYNDATVVRIKQNWYY